MGLEVGTYIQDLVDTNPPGTDKKKQGDDHIRLIKSVAKNTFPNAGRAFYLPVVLEKDADYAPVSGDENAFVLWDTSGGDLNANLPSPAFGGWRIVFMKKTTDTNIITVTPPSGTINGEDSFEVSTPFAPVEIVFDGVNFWASVSSLPNPATFNGPAIFANTDYIKGPVGTTAQRPDTPEEGMYRYNSTLHMPEFYNSVSWIGMGPYASPQGRLSLSSSSPTPNTSQVDSSLVYYHACGGGYIPIYDGSIGVMLVPFSSPLSLTLNNNHDASGIYDVFAFLDSGTLRIGTGPKWSNVAAGSGARGTGAGTTQLSVAPGFRVNNVSITARNGASTYSVDAKEATYLGSIAIEAAGKCTCHVDWGQSRRWGVWNAYNRCAIVLAGGDSSASWTRASATIRASHNDSTNMVRVFTGLDEEFVDLEFVQRVEMELTSATGDATPIRSSIGIGVNSTTAISGTSGSVGVASGTFIGISWTPTAKHHLPPGLGIQDIQALEVGQATAGIDSNFFGGQDDMRLVARYMG